MPAINNGNNNQNPNKDMDLHNGPVSFDTGINDDASMTGDTGYPKGHGRFTSSLMDGGVALTPDSHFKHHNNAQINREYIDPAAEDRVYLKPAESHFIRDVNDNNLRDVPSIRSANESDGVATENIGNVNVAVFAGSATNINSFNSVEMDRLLEPDGFHRSEIQLNAHGDPTKDGTPEQTHAFTSPLHPFTSLHPTVARNALFNHYNRTKLPVADAEWRKGFRHIFITRPECYIMAMNNGQAVLSEQCTNDEDFYSAYMRVPHLCSLLSPVYVTGSFSLYDWQSNWNYLLSNRVMGLSNAQAALSIDENVPKSIEGFTVTPAKLFESESGASLELTFRDTRNLEVYDCLRLWMLYAYKCKRGILASSYNGYQYSNGFIQGIDTTGTGTKIPSAQSLIYHPYDRALDYCCTIFDIVTNEAGSKILYWCKYYGCYPVTASNSLSNENGAAITNEMNVSASFRYQKKKEFSIHNLVEFNYNAGLCDAMGNVTGKAVSSLPFLLREDYENPAFNHLGAAGMFTGSPYIVLESHQHDSMSNMNLTIPYLRFMPDNDTKLVMSFQNIQEETSTILSY
jgi:hypothetical protein